MVLLYVCVSTAAISDRDVVSDERYLSDLCLVVALSADVPPKEDCWLMWDCIKINGHKVDSHLSTSALQTFPECLSTQLCSGVASKLLHASAAPECNPRRLPYSICT